VSGPSFFWAAPGQLTLRRIFNGFSARHLSGAHHARPWIHYHAAQRQCVADTNVSSISDTSALKTQTLLSMVGKFVLPTDLGVPRINGYF